MAAHAVSLTSNDEYEDYCSRLQADSNCRSLLKKYLTREVFSTIKDRETLLGGTLELTVRSGRENTDSGIGVYATDPTAYHTFSPLFDSIIFSYHELQPDFKQPPLYYGNPKSLENIDPDRKYIISTRIRCARSIEGFPMNSLLTKEQYLEIEEKVKKILADPSTGLRGEYRSLSDMSDSLKQRLVQEHYLFKEGDRFLQAANACQHWPFGRGMFLNVKRTLGLWINEEDHLRIFSMQSDANLPEIYARLVSTLKALESSIEFVRDDRLGYLTFCPSNIGTTIRASVHIRLPQLAQNRDLLEEIAEKYGLQVRGTHGEHSEVNEGLFDISNKSRCGLNEFDVVTKLQDGIIRILEIEQAKESFSDI